MNILEHYIIELEVLEKVSYDFTNDEYYKIKVTTDCHGHIEAREDIVSEQESRKAQQRGYFLW